MSEEKKRRQETREDKGTLLEQNSDRFLGVADTYDNSRPTIPPYLCETVISYIGRKPRIIVDIGCGTGLSTRPWVPYATEKVIGIDPNPDMIEQAAKVSKGSPTYKQAYAHETGLPDGCADIVVFASSFHWVDPKTVMPEVDRILAPGGAVVILDAVWPPSIPGCWKSEKVFEKCMDVNMKLVIERGHIAPRNMSAANFSTLKALENEGMFAWVRKLYFNSEEKGSWKRLVMLMESCSPVNLMLSKGASREECCLTELESVAKEEMGSELRTWIWSMGITLALKK